MKKRVFIVNGKPRAGKDTFAEMLNEFVKVHKYSSVTKVKALALDMGWDGGKSEKDRKFLSDLKMLTTEYSDMSFKDICEEVEKFMSGAYDVYNRNVMLIDIREPKEIARAVKAFGAVTIFIDNCNVEEVLSNSADANANIWSYSYDYIIPNNGTLDDFRNTIRKFYNDVIK